MFKRFLYLLLGILLGMLAGYLVKEAKAFNGFQIISNDLPLVNNLYHFIREPQYQIPESAITDEEKIVSFPGTSRFAKVPRKYVALFEETAEQYQIPVKYLAAVASYESHFRAHAQSRDGGCGMFQATTWKNWGFPSLKDCLDPQQNINKFGESWSKRHETGLDWPAVVRYHNGKYSYDYEKTIMKWVSLYAYEPTL